MATEPNLLPDPEASTDIALIEATDVKNVMEIIRAEDHNRLKQIMANFNALQKKYGKKKLVITDLDNKEEMKIYREGMKALRDFRGDTELERIEKVGPYNAVVSFFNTNYFKIIELVKEVEAFHKAKKVALEEAKKQKELKEALEKKERERVRIAQLVSAGAAQLASGEGGKVKLLWFVGSEKHKIPVVSLLAEEVGVISDAIFDNLLAQMVEKKTLIDAAEETERQEIAAQLLAQEKAINEEKLKLENDKKALQASQDALLQQVEELKRQNLSLLAASQPKAADTPPEVPAPEPDEPETVIPPDRIIEAIKDLASTGFDSSVIAPIIEAPQFIAPEIKKPTRHFVSGGGGSTGPSVVAQELWDKRMWQQFLNQLNAVQCPEMSLPQFKEYRTLAIEKIAEINALTNQPLP